jgi:hypothetical protein
MITLTADEKMSAVLNQANELAEIRDGSGKLIGFFAPLSLPHPATYANATAHIDPRGIQRRKDTEQEGRPTQDVLARLKSLEEG